MPISMAVNMGIEGIRCVCEVMSLLTKARGEKITDIKFHQLGMVWWFKETEKLDVKF